VRTQSTEPLLKVQPKLHQPLGSQWPAVGLWRPSFASNAQSLNLAHVSVSSLRAAPALAAVPGYACSSEGSSAAPGVAETAGKVDFTECRGRCLSQGAGCAGFVWDSGSCELKQQLALAAAAIQSAVSYVAITAGQADYVAAPRTALVGQGLVLANVTEEACQALCTAQSARCSGYATGSSASCSNCCWAMTGSVSPTTAPGVTAFTPSECGMGLGGCNRHQGAGWNGAGLAGKEQWAALSRA
jgi:hypothetical protein